MVASQAVLQQQGPEDIAAEMAAGMVESAETGDWERVEEIAIRLRSTVMLVPEARRRQVLVAAQRSAERVEALARRARGQVTDKLSALRRGKDAARAYTAAD